MDAGDAPRPTGLLDPAWFEERKRSSCFLFVFISGTTCAVGLGDQRRRTEDTEKQYWVQLIMNVTTHPEVHETKHRRECVHTSEPLKLAKYLRLVRYMPPMTTSITLHL